MQYGNVWFDYCGLGWVGWVGFWYSTSGDDCLIYIRGVVVGLRCSYPDHSWGMCPFISFFPLHICSNAQWTILKMTILAGGGTVKCGPVDEPAKHFVFTYYHADIDTIS